jgi:type I restriction enzyme R subunit
MQAIARANRVWGEKVNGLIVDYIGVFRDLQKALAIYGSASGGGVEPGELPVETKQALVEQLEEAIQETRDFLRQQGVELDGVQKAAKDASSFRGVAALEDAVDALLVNDDTKRTYLTMAGTVDQLFKAILPDQAANQFGVDRKAIVVIAEEIRSLIHPADISEVMGAVEELLDESIVPTKEGYVIREPTSGDTYLDLSKIDFEALKKQFEKGRKHIEAEKLRGRINAKLLRMVRLNKSRMDYYQKFQELIDEYNSGARNVDSFFAALITLAQDLDEEEKRGIAEQLSEEELALFDLLTKPDPKLSRKEKAEVKEVARELLDTLKAERLVLDWRKRQQTRAGVQVTIRDTFYKLPDAYSDELFHQKCQLVYQHVYDSYYGAARSVYSIAA